VLSSRRAAGSSRGLDERSPRATLPGHGDGASQASRPVVATPAGGPGGSAREEMSRPDVEASAGGSTRTGAIESAAVDASPAVPAEAVSAKAAASEVAEGAPSTHEPGAQEPGTRASRTQELGAKAAGTQVGGVQERRAPDRRADETVSVRSETTTTRRLRSVGMAVWAAVAGVAVLAWALSSGGDDRAAQAPGASVVSSSSRGTSEPARATTELSPSGQQASDPSRDQATAQARDQASDEAAPVTDEPAEQAVALSSSPLSESGGEAASDLAPALDARGAGATSSSRSERAGSRGRGGRANTARIRDSGGVDGERGAGARSGPSPHDLEKARQAYNAGNQALFSGNTERAIESYREAVRLGSAAGYRGLGLAYSQRGDKARAIQSFQKYVAKSPGAKDVPLIKKRIAALSR
jgi:hypothetical protein